MMTPHSTAKAVRRLSEEALGRLYFSNGPSVDNFSLLRYKKIFESMLLNGEADEQDIAALGMVYFNLSDKDNFEKCLIQNMERLNSVYLLKMYVSGKLHMKWLNKSKDSEDELLSFWFNHPINKDKSSIDFNSYLREIAFLKRLYVLEHTLCVMISISENRTVTMTAGPLKYMIEYDAIPSANFRYQFCKEISIDVFNKTFTKEKQEFLRYYMGSKFFESALKMITPKKISTLPNKSKYFIADI
ncbi:hypothetical protein LEP1GSC084_1071 [Leptospira interrogans serovar Medanensis str. L0448]|uniref:hypothetical protein n=1 Tax=Leptospira interrogans TaxID=173 RepID=UPI00029794D2|nr:hypothetical protein [Leptospira interrogans]EKR82537.1 hypothetical protein LEP1GSC099_1444 [Leptospira interrogans str. UI 08452]EMN33190.1 hypothetical protein LEP1GSC084_1071 [Leptospira interrogans serovar Medanensis str. L0448]EMN38305.1 hypothetical protein LEP1GSC085_0038 [Leptospira interrogans str. L0996]